MFKLNLFYKAQDREGWAHPEHMSRELQSCFSWSWAMEQPICMLSWSPRSDLTLVQWGVWKEGELLLWSLVLGPHFCLSHKKSIQEDSIFFINFFSIHSLCKGVGETESGLGYICQFWLSLTQLQLNVLKEGKTQVDRLNTTVPWGKKYIRKTILKSKIHLHIALIFPTQAESFQTLPGEWKQMEG